MKHFVPVLASCLLAACGADEPQPPELALVTPPIEAVTPAGFLASARPSPHLLDSADFKSRFFEDGPTDVFRILQAVDDRLTGYNERASDCMLQAPVAYTIDAFGQSIDMSAQCFEQDSAGFRQFGVADGVTYIYEKGTSRLAAIVTDDSADVWMAVGEDDHFTDQSYGVIQLHADVATGAFEMTVAGMGFGYCGAQLSSDGASVYGIGSLDMGATCNATDTLCVDATDLSTDGACDDLDALSLPALGREAADIFGASQYPATPNLTLDGTATDDSHFGPDEPTAGVGEI